MKSMNYDELVVGNKYYIVCGIWRGIYTFAGFHDYSGYRNSVPVFTLGSASEYDKQFNIVDYRSNIKVYEIPDADETANQGEPVDVENNTASACICSFCFHYHRKLYQRKTNKNLYCNKSSSPFYHQSRLASHSCSYFLPK